MIGCSVIIVSYHSGPIFFATLKRVLSQNNLTDVIVVDNGNPPAVLARLQQFKLSEPRLKVISGQGNLGFSKSCNLAVAQAMGSYLLFLHPDCLIPPDALTHAVQALRETPGAKLAGCWLVNPDGSEELVPHRHFLTPVAAFKYLLYPSSGKLRTPIVPSMSHEVPAIPSSFMCISKEDFNRLHGFDEDYFLCVEDIDLCHRIHLAGGKIIRVPRIQSVHMHTSSETLASWGIRWHHTRGLMRYYRKHFPRLKWLLLQPLLDLLLLVAYFVSTRLPVLRKALGSAELKRMDRVSKRLKLLELGLAEIRETNTLAAHRVLLTGATSQIGLFTIRHLIAGGATVIAVSRDESPPFTHRRLQWIQGDLTRANTELLDVRADVLVHCAPMPLLPGLIKLLENSGLRRVIAFNNTAAFARIITSNRYEKTLAAALKSAESEFENTCTEKLIPWTVFRTTTTYGAGIDDGVTWMVDFIKRYGFFCVYPPAQGRRHPLHAEDAAQAVLQSLNNPATHNKVYNLSGGEVLSFREMLERCFRLCQRKPRIIETTLLPFALDVVGCLLHKKHINGEAAYRMNDDQIYFHDPAHTDFGFTPRAFLSAGSKDIEGV